MHTSAIVEYNIQHYTFLSQENFTDNSMFDFNYFIVFSRYISQNKKHEIIQYKHFKLRFKSCK
jgi:hypothetical protein